MGGLSYQPGTLSGRSGVRGEDRYVLRYPGHSVDIHARHHGYHSGQMDSGAEAAGYLPRSGRCGHDRGRYLRRGGRGGGAVRHPLRAVCGKYRLLHAYHRYFQLGGLYHPREGRQGSRQGFPADKGMGYSGLYLLDVVRGPGALPRCGDAGDLHAVCGVRSVEYRAGSLYAYPA